jgi:UDP-glucose 4-epimerase
MKPRLLLTGGGGFVGSHTLIHFLHNTDWEIVVLDSFMHMGKTDRISADAGHPPCTINLGSQ